MTGISHDPWRPADISDERLINILHRAVVEIAFVTYALMLFYVSFVPFDFAKPTPHPTPFREICGLPIVPSGLPDILANIAVYVPLGALVFAVWRRRGVGRILSVIASLIFALVISFLVEQGQRWIGSRVASWIDVTANATGCLIGAVLIAVCEGQVQRMVERARWAAARNWWLTLCKLAVCVVLVTQLRPYDLVVDAIHTAADLRRANFSPLNRWNQLPADVALQTKQGRVAGRHELARRQWEYGIDRGIDVATYAAVAALAVIGLRPQFVSSVALHLWSGFISASLAMMVMLIRIFLISHGLDTSHLFCGLAGWVIGCVVGQVILRHLARAHLATADLPEDTGTPARRSRPAGTMPAWQKGAIVFTLAAVAALELAPFDFTVRTDGKWLTPVSGVCWLPFEAHFHSRPNDAFFDLSGDFLRYTSVGLCLAFILGGQAKRRWRRQLGKGVLLTGAVCLFLEGIHIYMPSRQADMTTLVLALAGGFVGAVSVRWAGDYRNSLPLIIADDLLTRQLVEGRTYQTPPIITPRQSSAKPR